MTKEEAEAMAQGVSLDMEASPEKWWDQVKAENPKGSALTQRPARKRGGTRSVGITLEEITKTKKTKEDAEGPERSALTYSPTHWKKRWLEIRSRYATVSKIETLVKSVVG